MKNTKRIRNGRNLKIYSEKLFDDNGRIAEGVDDFVISKNPVYVEDPEARMKEIFTKFAELKEAEEKFLKQQRELNDILPKNLNPFYTPNMRSYLI